MEFLDIKIEGVAAALANISEGGGVDPVIKATLTLSESGFITVPEAFAYADVKDESIAGK
jgi:hypoxia up-regulated 1